MILGIHHAQITVPKGAEAEAKAFYCGVLGLKETPKPENLQGRGGFWLQLVNGQVHVGAEDGVDRDNTKAHVAYAVDNLEELRGLLAKHGIESIDGIPIPGYDRFEFRDPFCNRVEFIQRQHTPSQKLPTLYTDRLILRALTDDDALSIFAYASDPDVSKYTLWEPHKTVVDSLGFIKGYAHKNYEAGMPEPWGIALKDKPEAIIGTVGCFWEDESNRCMELAYAIAKPHWGQGLVIEAATVALSFVFERYPVERMQCRCKLENRASARVMAKLGFRPEGLLRSQVWHRGRYWDMHVTSILKSEWRVPD